MVLGSREDILSDAVLGPLFSSVFEIQRELAETMGKVTCVVPRDDVGSLIQYQPPLEAAFLKLSLM